MADVPLHVLAFVFIEKQWSNEKKKVNVETKVACEEKL